MLGAIQGSPVQARSRHTGESPTGTGVSFSAFPHKRPGTAQPGEEKSQEDLINVDKYMNGGYKDDGVRLFLRASSVSTISISLSQKLFITHHPSFLEDQEEEVENYFTASGW